MELSYGAAIMRIFITGISGQLGKALSLELKKQNIEFCGISSSNLNITNRSAVIKAITDYQPDVVIHCAAYTQVDLAEENPEICFAINVNGTENVAIACLQIGAKMLYVSTDYVFDGTGTQFYETTDIPHPVNVYGKSKRKGEELVCQILKQFYILRTSWMFSIHGNNFVNSILNLANKQNIIHVVNDQIGSPTYAPDLSILISNLIKTEKYGIYHATNEELCSWAEFAQEIIVYGKKHSIIQPIKSEAYLTKAVRPHNSRLSKRSLDKGGFTRLPSWKNALSRYFAEVNRIEDY